MSTLANEQQPASRVPNGLHLGKRISDLSHEPIGRVGLGDETTCVRDCAIQWLRPTRGDDGFDGRPPGMRLPSEAEAIEIARHVDVGEQHAHVGVLRQDLQSRSRIFSLKDPKAAFLKHIGGDESQNGFVIDDEHEDGRRAVI